MKTRLAILVALAATAGVSTGASADILAPAAPGVSDLKCSSTGFVPI